MSQQLANFASTTLSGAIDNVVTSVAVTDGTVFPATGNFYVLVENEIMKVTARATNTLTVVRGQEGTTAAAHAVASIIKLTLTGQTFDDYFGELHSTGSYASFPTNPRPGQSFYATDMAAAWRYNGTNWDMIHPCFVPAANRMTLTGFTAFNAGTSVWTNQGGTVNAEMPLSGSDNIRGYTKALPTAPYTLNLILRMPPIDAQFFMAGVCLFDGTKLFTIGYLMNNAFQLNASVETYNNPTSFSSTQFRQPVYTKEYLQFRIRDDNTNWNFEYTMDGKNFVNVNQFSRNTFLTATQGGFYCNRSEGTYPSTVSQQYLAYWVG